jgi:Domain of unknown function (DUF4062)/Effector-associated domain 9
MAKIYLSSTYADLKDYREAVYDLLRKVGHDVIAMEDYVATDRRPVKKCEEDVVASDLYVGLIAWRYGFVPQNDNPVHLSVTESEFRKAGTVPIPRLMFLAHDQAAFAHEFRDAKTGDNDAGGRIKAFREELCHDFVISFFKLPDQLAGLVLASVVRALENRPASPGGSFNEVERKALNERIKALSEEYEVVALAINETIDPDVVVKLERKLKTKAQKVAKIETELKALG